MSLRFTALFALSALLLVGAVAPAIDRRLATRALGARIRGLDAVGERASICAESEVPPTLRQQRLSALLVSWRSVGGCGASAATGAGAGGLKWIGRSVRGGVVGVQCQGTYSALTKDPTQLEHDFALNTLLTHELGDRIVIGASVPLVYKYLVDPYELDVDLSNGGIGDVSLQATYKLGPIGATAVTASLGLPTGAHDTSYMKQYLRQHQQRGFGKVAAAVSLDHTLDETWGLVVLGGSGAWRGGENELGNYRAPSASAYGYAGIYLGPFMPALGITASGYAGHDRDRTQPEKSALFSLAANVSLEWSTDWLALLLAASLPYQYDGQPANPWGLGAWTVALGVAVAP